jgi:SAM-dependent methyltransferase
VAAGVEEGPTPPVTDLDRARALWAQVNEAFTDGDAMERWAADELGWGLFRIPEAELGVLGDVAGLDVVELGCGTAYVSAHLARAGARPVALDLSHHQLRSAHACQARFGVRFPLVEADGEVLPLVDASADLVVSEYGAAPWCDPQRWLPEAARILRPGGRLVFLTNSVLAAMCVPEAGGFAGTALLQTQPEVATITWPGGGREHHPGHGRWIALLTEAGFRVEALHELHAPEGAATPLWYEIVTADWAQHWPAEDLWVASLRR